MKQRTYKSLLLLVFGTFLVLSVNAQYDVILKLNGEEMEGKVSKINENNLEFTYKNETIQYTVKKSEIEKITFGSGRIQFFNKKGGNVNSNLEEHHNKVAVLPFGYIKDQERSNVTMTKKIQQETYTIFKRQAISLKFQDPLTTNALLAKAGVNNNNIEGYTMGEICNILNVEYVVQGLVSIERTTVSNYGSTSKQSKSNKDLHVDKNGKIVGDVWNNNSRSSSSFSSSTSVQNYSTNITMNVYTDKGDNIYTKEHSSFWQTEDAYKITLTFLAKRTPVYKR